MQAENDDDLDGGQRSSEVKWGKLCDMATIFGQKKPLMQAKNDDDDIHGGQRSSEVKYGNMCHGYHIWSKELLMQVKNDDDDFTEVKGHQRSNVVNYATKLGRKSS